MAIDSDTVIWTFRLLDNNLNNWILFCEYLNQLLKEQSYGEEVWSPELDGVLGERAAATELEDFTTGEARGVAVGSGKLGRHAQAAGLIDFSENVMWRNECECDMWQKSWLRHGKCECLVGAARLKLIFDCLKFELWPLTLQENDLLETKDLGTTPCCPYMSSYRDEI
ncbi:hypothetical protein LXL04_014271 [Taraxacum kok-saghyz]